MKKALLSLAVIAASGAYVVYEGHAAQQPSEDNSAAAVVPRLSNPPSSPAPARDAFVSQPAAPAIPDAAPTAFVVTAPPAATPIAVTEPDTPVDAAPPQVAAATTEPTGLASVPAPIAPYPRTRPADAPVAVVAVSTQAAAAQGRSGYRDGTFQGVSANAYYGRVEVDAVIKAGQVVKVDILDYPSDRRTSRNINSRALPELQQEAIAAQSASIDTVSGATLSSEAFIQSLDSALQQAHGGGNA